MRKIILFLLLIINLNIFSQNIEVKYNVSENTNDPVLATSTTYNLILNENNLMNFLIYLY